LLPRNCLQELEEDEYYWHDIIGLNVFSEDGRYLGTIRSIFPTGSNDVYVCQNDDEEILIPAIADVIARIDLAERRMIIRLLKGLCRDSI